MAHSAKKKAAVVEDLVKGERSVREIADVHEVGLGTVSRWADELKTEQNGTLPVTTEARMELFENEIFGLMVATVKAVRVMAETISDGDYIREHPDDAIRLLETVRDSSDRVMAAVNAASAHRRGRDAD